MKRILVKSLNKYSKATSSCTGALHLAPLALNINKGDEVIVPDFMDILL